MRPSTHDPKVVAELCARIAEGNAIGVICRSDDMPSETEIYRRMASDPDFASAIARAREAQQDAEAEKIVQMADEATAEDWQVVKLRIWARQWRAAKLAPKRYGDKQTTTIEGGDKPIQTEDVTPLEAARKVAFALALGAQALKEK